MKAALKLIAIEIAITSLLEKNVRSASKQEKLNKLKEKKDILIEQIIAEL